MTRLRLTWIGPAAFFFPFRCGPTGGSAHPVDLAAHHADFRLADGFLGAFGFKNVKVVADDRQRIADFVHQAVDPRLVPFESSAGRDSPANARRRPGRSRPGNRFFPGMAAWAERFDAPMTPAARRRVQGQERVPSPPARRTSGRRDMTPGPSLRTSVGPSSRGFGEQGISPRPRVNSSCARRDERMASGRAARNARPVGRFEPQGRFCVEQDFGRPGEALQPVVRFPGAGSGQHAVHQDDVLNAGGEPGGFGLFQRLGRAVAGRRRIGQFDSELLGRGDQFDFNRLEGHPGRRWPRRRSAVRAFSSSLGSRPWMTDRRLASRTMRTSGCAGGAVRRFMW